MKKLQNLFTLLLLFFFGLSANTSLQAQCENWVGSPNMAEAETAHVLYRQEVKNKNYAGAYENWKKAYELAPAADGKRPSHYADGRKILKDMWEKETDDAKKKELADFILKLYDQQIECYKNEAALLGFKGYDMFYYFRTPYPTTKAVLKKALDLSKKETSYTVLDPYATIAVYDFTNEKIDKAEAREIHALLMEVADHNINNGNKYAAQYQQAKDAVVGRFAEIEDNIFDCEYFKPGIMADYKANENDPTTIENTIRRLKQRACPEDDAFLKEVEANWAKYAAAENAKRKADYEANNPDVMARKMRKAGDYAGALAKYQEAIGTETDPKKLALYHYQSGQIYNQQKKFSSGMASARKAAEIRPDWGNPHMLMGDLMVGNSSKCGSALQQKGCYMAAIAKYRKAKSVDPSVSDRADEKISRYSSSRYRLSGDDKETAFMQGYKEGSTLKLPCIGTSVTLRF